MKDGVITPRCLAVFGLILCLVAVSSPMMVTASVIPVTSFDESAIDCSIVPFLPPETQEMQGAPIYAAQEDLLTYTNVGGAVLRTVGGAFLDDGGSFTDYTDEIRSAAVGDVDLLPAIPAENDAFYFREAGAGAAGLSIVISTSGVGTWTITWEYYTSDTWTALDGVTDNTENAGNGIAFTAAAGTHIVSFTNPVSPQEVEVNNVFGYYIRARVSAYTNVTTQPKGTSATRFGPFEYSSYQVDTIGLFRNLDAYLYTDKGAGNDDFNDDFNAYFTATYQTATANLATGIVWSVANVVDDYNGQFADDVIAVLLQRHDASGGPRVILTQQINGGGGTSDTYTIPTSRLNRPLSYHVFRDDDAGANGVVTLKVYTDLQRSTLLDTLTVNLAATENFRYMYAACSQNAGTTPAISFVSGDYYVNSIPSTDIFSTRHASLPLEADTYEDCESLDGWTTDVDGGSTFEVSSTWKRNGTYSFHSKVAAGEGETAGAYQATLDDTWEAATFAGWVYFPTGHGLDSGDRTMVFGGSDTVGGQDLMVGIYNNGGPFQWVIMDYNISAGAVWTLTHSGINLSVDTDYYVVLSLFTNPRSGGDYATLMVDGESVTAVSLGSPTFFTNQVNIGNLRAGLFNGGEVYVDDYKYMNGVPLMGGIGRGGTVDDGGVTTDDSDLLFDHRVTEDHAYVFESAAGNGTRLGVFTSTANGTQDSWVHVATVPTMGWDGKELDWRVMRIFWNTVKLNWLFIIHYVTDDANTGTGQLIYEAPEDFTSFGEWVLRGNTTGYFFNPMRGMSGDLFIGTADYFTGGGTDDETKIKINYATFDTSDYTMTIGAEIVNTDWDADYICTEARSWRRAEDDAIVTSIMWTNEALGVTTDTYRTISISVDSGVNWIGPVYIEDSWATWQASGPAYSNGGLVWMSGRLGGSDPQSGFLVAVDNNNHSRVRQTSYTSTAEEVGNGDFDSQDTGSSTAVYLDAAINNTIRGYYSMDTGMTRAQLTTQAADAPGSTTVNLNANLISEGTFDVTDLGFVYGTTSVPTAPFGLAPASSGYDSNCGQEASHSTGAFDSDTVCGGITGLEPGTTYYFRPYAITIVGTVYGAELEFRTHSGFRPNFMFIGPF